MDEQIPGLSGTHGTMSGGQDTEQAKPGPLPDKKPSTSEDEVWRAMPVGLVPVIPAEAARNRETPAVMSGVPEDTWQGGTRISLEETGPENGQGGGAVISSGENSSR